MTFSVSSLYGGQVCFSNHPPKLIVICGPCRVGTTALSMVFAESSVESHMQPIKSARRAKEIGQEPIPWKIGNKNSEFALAKETLGVKTEAEFFDPLDILLNLGYPKQRLVLIPILRDPRQTLASWKEKWGHVEFQKFVLAHELTLEIMEKAEKNGVLTIPYVHEMIRDKNPEVVAQKLFEKIGLVKRQSSKRAKARWKDLKENKNVFLYDSPPDKFIDGIKERGKHEYRYRVFSARDEKLVESFPRLDVIYEIFYKLCQNCLDF